MLSVRERENSVAVRFLEQGLEKTLLTRTVLLTTPAPVTLNLLDTMTDRSRSYLESLDYREGTVVAPGAQECGPARLFLHRYPDASHEFGSAAADQ